jgi:hypothetical protein
MSHSLGHEQKRVTPDTHLVRKPLYSDLRATVYQLQDFAASRIDINQSLCGAKFRARS